MITLERMSHLSDLEANKTVIVHAPIVRGFVVVGGFEPKWWHKRSLAIATSDDRETVTIARRRGRPFNVAELSGEGYFGLSPSRDRMLTEPIGQMVIHCLDRQINLWGVEDIPLEPYKRDVLARFVHMASDYARRNQRRPNRVVN